jgi:hypothetical protein
MVDFAKSVILTSTDYEEAAMGVRAAREYVILENGKKKRIQKKKSNWERGNKCSKGCSEGANATTKTTTRERQGRSTSDESSGEGSCNARKSNLSVWGSYHKSCKGR